MKIKWKVNEKPTGPYRAFQRRGWPTATIEDVMAFRIECEDDYVPSLVATGRHAELKIKVADWRASQPGDHSFIWQTIKARAKTLDEAKQIAERFLRAHPEFFHRP